MSNQTFYYIEFSIYKSLIEKSLLRLNISNLATRNVISAQYLFTYQSRKMLMSCMPQSHSVYTSDLCYIPQTSRIYRLIFFLFSLSFSRPKIVETPGIDFGESMVPGILKFRREPCNFDSSVIPR